MATVDELAQRLSYLESKITALELSKLNAFTGGGETAGWYYSPDPTYGGIIFVNATDTYNPEDGTGTYQIRLGNDGKLYAGGGKVLSDSTGITLDGAGGVLRWLDGSGNEAARLIYSSALPGISLVMQSGFQNVLLGGKTDVLGSIGSYGYEVLESDFVDTTGSFADVTGMSFAIAADETYVFDFHLITNQSSTGAIRVCINGPAGATLNATDFGTTADAATYTSGRLTTLGSGAISFNTAAGFDGFIQVRGSIVNGSTAGTVQLQAKRQTANGNARIYAGSTMVTRRVV